MKYFLTLTNELGDELDKVQVETDQTLLPDETDSFNLNNSFGNSDLTEQIAMCIDQADQAAKDEDAAEEAKQVRADAKYDAEMEACSKDEGEDDEDEDN